MAIEVKILIEDYKKAESKAFESSVGKTPLKVKEDKRNYNFYAEQLRKYFNCSWANLDQKIEEELKK